LPYTVPTAASFKIRFPRFTGLSDSRVDLALADAAAEVPLTWIETDYQPGIWYLAAHLLMIDDALYTPPVEGGEEGGSPSGGSVTLEEKLAQATGISVGDVRVNFSSSGSSSTVTRTSSGHGVVSGAEGLTATIYGQRFLELEARNMVRSHAFLRA
jgi:hypothetical protein